MIFRKIWRSSRNSASRYWEKCLKIIRFYQDLEASDLKDLKKELEDVIDTIEYLQDNPDCIEDVIPDLENFIHNKQQTILESKDEELKNRFTLFQKRYYSITHRPLQFAQELLTASKKRLVKTEEDFEKVESNILQAQQQKFNVKQVVNVTLKPVNSRKIENCPKKEAIRSISDLVAQLKTCLTSCSTLERELEENQFTSEVGDQSEFNARELKEQELEKIKQKLAATRDELSFRFDCDPSSTDDALFKLAEDMKSKINADQIDLDFFSREREYILYTVDGAPVYN